MAVVLFGDNLQRSRAPEINPNGEKHDRYGRDARLNFNRAQKQSPESLIDDPDAGDEQQARLDKRRKTLEFAVAVLVVGIRRLVAHPHREQRDHGSHQVKAGVQRLGENAQAPGGKPHHKFQSRDQHGGKNRVARNPAFFRAHRLRIECLLCHSLQLRLALVSKMLQLHLAHVCKNASGFTERLFQE